MNKKQKGQTEDNNYTMDVDRMINEGLAGGTVVETNNRYPQIDSARELDHEEPPNHN